MDLIRELNYNCNDDIFRIAYDMKTVLVHRDDRAKVSLWMNKIMKNCKTLEELRMRNEFMHALAQNVHNGKLETPFNQQPTRAALKFFARSLPGYEATPIQEDETMSMLRFLPAKDGGFLLPKPLPHIGAYCYIATNNKNTCIKECNYT